MLFFVHNATSKCQNENHTVKEKLEAITTVKYTPMNIRLLVHIFAILIHLKNMHCFWWMNITNPTWLLPFAQF